MRDIKGIEILTDSAEDTVVPDSHFLILAKNRNKLNIWLKSKGIRLISHDYPCSVFSRLEMFSSFIKGKYPNSDEFLKKALFLPMFTFLKGTEAMYIVDQIKGFYAKRR